jgi:nicotinate phosphoribosyltransferase
MPTFYRRARRRSSRRSRAFDGHALSGETEIWISARPHRRPRGHSRQAADIALSAGPIAQQTDKYFTNTSRIVAANGDAEVTFAVFMRRRVVAALEPTIRLVKRFVPEARIKRFYEEGDIVPSESKMLEITGSMARLSEVETLLLQKTGFPCVSANNAYEMCRAIPGAAFMDMHARHASGAEMNILAAYGAAVGSAAAKRADPQVKGFIGSSQDLTAPFFGSDGGMGTMPHALVGYTGGDVLESMKLFARNIPEAETLVSLVDYTGDEVTDSLRCAKWFYEEAKLQAKGKRFGVRLDTHEGALRRGARLREIGRHRRALAGHPWRIQYRRAGLGRPRLPARSQQYPGRQGAPHPVRQGGFGGLDHPCAARPRPGRL